MKLEAQIEDQIDEIEFDEEGGTFRCTVGDRHYQGQVLRPAPGVYTFLVDGRVVEARVGREQTADSYRVDVAGAPVNVGIIDRKRRSAGGDAGLEGRQTLVASMPGKVVAVMVAVGDSVEAGQGILVVEAMKMQNEFKSPKAGTVADIRVAEGETVNAGHVLAEIE